MSGSLGKVANMTLIFSVKRNKERIHLNDMMTSCRCGKHSSASKCRGKNTI